MKWLGVLILSTFVMAACSYDSGHDCTTDEIELAQQCGEEDAMKVVKIPVSEMAHEEAILQIRAKEQELRNAGFSSAADAYADAAEHTLQKEGLLK